MFARGAGGEGGGIMGSVTVPWSWKLSEMLQSWMRSPLQGEKLFDLSAINAQRTGYSCVYIVHKVYSIVNRYEKICRVRN